MQADYVAYHMLRTMWKVIEAQWCFISGRRALYNKCELNVPLLFPNLSLISAMAGKRRRKGIEYYDLDLPDTTTATTQSATIQSVQRYTEITAKRAYISTTQRYYEVDTPNLTLPKPGTSKIVWNMQPVPDNNDSAFDKPLNFINPPDVIVELEATADRVREIVNWVHPLFTNFTSLD